MAKFSEIPEGLQYIIRATRNRMLSVTDRLMQSDRPENNSELLAYRKKLRDLTDDDAGPAITINDDDMPDLTWPTKPDSILVEERKVPPFPQNDIDCNQLFPEWSR